MTAVAAEGPGETRPDLWADLTSTIDRAGGSPDRLWIDDSKKVYAAGKGTARLEAAVRALAGAIGLDAPSSPLGWFSALGAGSLADVELERWVDGENLAEPAAVVVPPAPFDGARWRIRSVRSLVLGPERFNALLDTGTNKAGAHFEVFRRLLASVWDDGEEAISVRGDKHGGRHFYFDPLGRAFPDCWIDRGEEGPAMSRYVLRRDSRRLELSLVPRADADDGLVALASMVSKFLRECWMDAFNAHWRARLPGLRPTAGYPVDARRFREAIEPLCEARGLAPRQWWRMK
jgi:hypothetical protein